MDSNFDEPVAFAGPNPLTGSLLNWYSNNRRQMPWRGHPDPYAVWVSEIMLQQTRVETVKPFFARWMARFPTVAALAESSQQEVLSLWEGLGYYSRARNLHQAAQSVVSSYGGVLPDECCSLRELPGIGPYTAAAIASIAFGQDVPAIDGNVRRVLARLNNLELPADSPDGRRQLSAWAEFYLPPGKAGEYNQALMDLGAGVCTPRNPACMGCPVKQYCQSFAAGVQNDRPVMKPRPRRPHKTACAVAVENAGRYLIRQRRENGLLGGLWQFPGSYIETGASEEQCIRQLIDEFHLPFTAGRLLGKFRHSYTHFHLTLHAYYCSLDGRRENIEGEAGGKWVSLRGLDRYPMGKIDRAIARHLHRERK